MVPTTLNHDLCLFSGSDGGDDVGFCQLGVPGVAIGVEDCPVGIPGAVAEGALPRRYSEMFSAEFSSGE